MDVDLTKGLSTQLSNLFTDLNSRLNRKNIALVRRKGIEEYLVPEPAQEKTHRETMNKWENDEVGEADKKTTKDNTDTAKAALVGKILMTALTRKTMDRQFLSSGRLQKLTYNDISSDESKQKFFILLNEWMNKEKKAVHTTNNGKSDLKQTLSTDSVPNVVYEKISDSNTQALIKRYNSNY